MRRSNTRSLPGMILILAATLSSLIVPLPAQRIDVLARPAFQNANPIQVLESENNYFLKVDLRDPRVQPRVLLANNDRGGRESLSSMKNRLEGQGYTQWAMINGDVFSDSPPKPCPQNAAINCAQGLTYIEGQLKENWSEYGSTWPVRGSIGFERSNDVEIQLGGSQSKRYMTISGGPWALKDGIPTCSGRMVGDTTVFDASGEQFKPDVRWWCDDTRSITMIGYSQDKRYLYMGVSRGGKNVVQLATWLKAQGAHQVLRLDSGSSSGIYHNNVLRGGSAGRAITNAFAIVVSNDPPPPHECQVPGLRDPANGQVSNSHTVVFRWDGIGCAQNKYVLRIKTIPSMEGGGEQVTNINLNGTERTVTINDSRWHNRDLYWSVIPEVSGGRWAPARLFRIVPNASPHIAFDRANSQNITSNNQQVWANTRDWTFSGTASDSDGDVDHVDVYCSGDSCVGQGHRAGGTTVWSYQWNGLEGLNTISAYAYDNQNTRSPESDRYRLTLGVDLVAPTTMINLNDQSNLALWPEYFNVPVRVRLNAADSGTRTAISDVGELRYRIDGQAWQSVPTNSAVFDVSIDGQHSIQYAAMDRAGNHETEHTIAFKIDRTPPTLPAGVTEVQGVVSGQWQKNYPLPTFTWSASSDLFSGVAAYQFSLEEEQGSHEIITVEIPANQPRTWTPSKPEGLRTGSYRLRGRTRDYAGNWSDWTGPLFIFRYDKTAPENPAGVTHAAGIASEVWQRTTSQADFTWPVPHDEGSGINGYFVAWGTDPDVTSTTSIAQNYIQSSGSFCAVDAACTGYLRLRSSDKVGNLAEKWTTAFVLRYDNAPPTVDFSFAEGSTTLQTQITLRITGSDQGSGLTAMRFSHDGQIWTPWEAYATEQAWAILGISRQSWPVYLQVRDGVDLESSIISHTIYLDVNPQQPRSAGYRLFDRSLSAGSGTQTSPNYRSHSTVGQVVDSSRMVSGNYAIVGGYEASSRAQPIAVPGYATYRLISGLFSSGSGGEKAHSSQYQLISSFGEPALPNNQTELSSQQYHHQPGFLAAVFSGPTLPIPEPGPPPPPEPPLACPNPQVRINDTALFTDKVTVTLRICAPKATEMIVSNDRGLLGAQWEPYAATRAWILTASGQYVMPRYVYAAFKDADGTIHSTYFDEIIYDPNPPAGSVKVERSAALSNVSSVARHGLLKAHVPSQSIAMLANPNSSVNIQLDGMDDNSGIREVQISERDDFVGTAWEPYTSSRQWQPASGDGTKRVYVRFRDSAGNISAVANTQFILDTQPPLGGVALGQQVIGPETVTTTVYLGAQDTLSDVADMRISTQDNFMDAVWEPYTTERVWMPGAVAGNQLTLYVQYRDQTGNLSLVYSDTSTIDATPPVVYAEAAAGVTLTRQLTLFAYDDQSDLASLRLSNDPLMIDNVIALPYVPSVTWIFDDRRVVWVQVQDSTGNWSTPYPVYASDSSEAAEAGRLRSSGRSYTWWSSLH